MESGERWGGLDFDSEPYEKALEIFEQRSVMI